MQWPGVAVSLTAVLLSVSLSRKYRGSDADEIFLSFETTDTDQTICGFLRLRLPAKCDGMNAKEERIDAVSGRSLALQSQRFIVCIERLCVFGRHFQNCVDVL